MNKGNTEGDYIVASNFQIEEGTVATAYTPYVDVSAAKVKKYGLNLLDIDAGLNECLVKNADGSYTMTKLSENADGRMSKHIEMLLPKGTIVYGSSIVKEHTLQVYQYPLVVFYDNNKVQITTVTIGENGYNITLAREAKYLRIFIAKEEENGTYITFKNPQIAISDTPITNYEPYIEPIEYAISADGTVEGVNSLYPTTTLATDTNGVVIEAEYNRDINKAWADLDQRITALSTALLT